MSQAWLDQALDELVPEINGGQDWHDVARRARNQKPRLGRRGALLAIAAAAALVLAGVLVAGLITRTNILFSHAKPASNLVKRGFADLTVGEPPQFHVHPIADEARQVGTLNVGGKRIPLLVVPTREGGFCYTMETFGGCGAEPQQRAAHILGATWELANPFGSIIRVVGGWVLDARATSVQVQYKDGTHDTTPLLYVSKPIDAGFFIFGVPSEHLTATARVKSVVALDKDGHVLARESAPPSHRRPAIPAHEGNPPPVPLRLPPPARPLQRGNGNGVSVIAGANGVAVFDTRGISPHARALMGSVSYGCFRLTHEFGALDVKGLDIAGTLAPTAKMRFDGVGVPFDGCQMTGSYGHRWPDRNGGHAPVEIPLTPAGRRFFVDRAVARDLSLFVQLKRVRQVRAETGAALRGDLTRYRIRLVASPNASLATGRIGYALSASGVTFVERSPTGRRFFVSVKDGKIAGSNVKPYASVF